MNTHSIELPENALFVLGKNNDVLETKTLKAGKKRPWHLQKLILKTVVGDLF